MTVLFRASLLVLCAVFSLPSWAAWECSRKIEAGSCVGVTFQERSPSSAGYDTIYGVRAWDSVANRIVWRGPVIKTTGDDEEYLITVCSSWSGNECNGRKDLHVDDGEFYLSGNAVSGDFKGRLWLILDSGKAKYCKDTKTCNSENWIELPEGNSEWPVPLAQKLICDITVSKRNLSGGQDDSSYSELMLIVGDLVQVGPYGLQCDGNRCLREINQPETQYRSSINFDRTSKKIDIKQKHGDGSASLIIEGSGICTAAGSAAKKPPAVKPVVDDDEAWTDPSTGLVWRRGDNGRDVNWSQAGDYCAGLPGGWRLPSMDQLESLYGRGEMRCGTVEAEPIICKVPPQLDKLTSWFFWSRNINGPTIAGLVALHNKNRGFIPVSLSFNRRALCVRP